MGGTFIQMAPIHIFSAQSIVADKTSIFSASKLWSFTQPYCSLSFQTKISQLQVILRQNFCQSGFHNTNRVILSSNI